MTKPPSFELTKTCKSCYKTKPETDFGRKRKGRDTRCKSCKNQKIRELRKDRRRRIRGKREITRVIETRAKSCPDLKDRVRAIESILLDMALDMLTEAA